jgi:LacI family purine nucleotide synthesis repressor
MSVTLKELATRLNLSDTTVSDALKGSGSARVSAATRQRVREEARRLGYQPNVNARRLLQSRVEGLVPIFVSEIPSYATYLLERAHHLQTRLASLGYDAPLIIGNGGAQETTRNQILSLCGQRPVGIAWVCITWFGSEFTSILERYCENGGELVCLDWQEGENLPKGASGVRFDRIHNSFSVTNHLINLGHRSLGVFLGVKGNSAIKDHPRTVGVLKACEEERDGGCPPIQVRWFEVPFFPGPEAGVAVAEQFLSIAPADRPTGMVLLNDRTAMAFIARVQASGVRVPEDVSVVGHDDDEMSAFFPVPLTTITHPHRALAEATAEMMHRRISNKSSKEGEGERVIEVRGELRVRASAAAVTAPSLPGK